jgi:alpha-beta hydrolase superfamily lysophospholipase
LREASGVTEASEIEIEGARGAISVRAWINPEADHVVLLSHGYGEHVGRYDHVAERMLANGAMVVGPDHLGHGRSDGERALIEEGEDLTNDLHRVAELVRGKHPELPLVLVGHSMGGLVATRFAQRFGEELTALVISGPVIGGNPGFQALLDLDPIPEIPIDPEVLSRDPAVGEAYAADPLVYHGPFHRATLVSLLGGVEAVAAGGSLGDLPTLWIHGTEDALAPLEVTREAVEGIRGSRFEERIYEGARHEAFNETNKDEVLDDVARFIRGAL